MKIMNQIRRYGKTARSAAVGGALALMTPMALANPSSGSGFDAAAVGGQIASVIMGFVALVSAVGMAAITVILTVQGFKMAWSMVRSVR